MNNDLQTNSDHSEEWYEAFEAFDNSDEISKAIRINDPISSLDLKSPLSVETGTNLKNALRLLQKEKQNCLLILDNSELVGILTERDILLKVTGKGYDFELETVDEFMTKDPEYLTQDDPIAYALNKMHVGGFRHVPIVNDGLLPIGLISISDIITTIADYFSREIINLPPINRIVDLKSQEGG